MLAQSTAATRAVARVVSVAAGAARLIVNAGGTIDALPYTFAETDFASHIVAANATRNPARGGLACPSPVRYNAAMTTPEPRAPRTFTQVETWVFDLDNTLYPHHLNLWGQVDLRIRSYIASFLGIAEDEAFRLQKDYYQRYGTSMRGMMIEHGMKPDDYLEVVHQIDHSPIEPNPALGAALEKLPGRKLILTNGTRKHADAVMQRLAVHHHFDDVFDIVAAELEPKPSPQTYARFLATHGVDAARSAMFEDLARNLAVPHALGMTTVLVVPAGARAVVREDWELAGRDAPHVDHVTDDLVHFLERIAAERRA